MEKIEHIFRNQGVGTYNDDVFNSLVFNLENSQYKFLLQPSLKTKFWRFGLALSKTENFEFDPSVGRYSNDLLKFIEIDIGDKLKDEWILPNRIALSSRHIEGFKGHPKIKDEYTEFSAVDLELQFNSEGNVLISYESIKVKDSERFPIGGYKYFKIFAWADETPFEINCTILKRSIELALNLIEENKLTKSKALDISNCNISEIPSQLFELVWLEELVIGNDSYYDYKARKAYYTPNTLDTNKISFFPIEFQNLRNLKKLVISGSITQPLQVKDLTAIGGLYNLELLYIIFTTLSDLHFVSNLKKLKTFVCNSNRVEDITPLSENLSLQVIDLGYNGISDLSPLSGLTNVKILRADNNQIVGVKPLEKLTKIQKLKLNNNKISDIIWMSKMTELKELNLNYNQIFQVDTISSLRGLEVLDLSYNQLFDIIAITQLTRLRELSISYNRVEDLTPLSGLKHLSVLHFRNSLVKRLKPLINFHYLRDFDATGCPIEDCPADIFETKDVNQLKAYFEAISADKLLKKTPATKNKHGEKLLDKKRKKAESSEIKRDVKLILLGNSNSGKTNLIEYLKKGKFTGIRNSTHGLEVHHWLPNKNRFPKLKDIAVSIWDFGGQEYYHGAYRLFLSANAVYVLLWCRETNLNGKVQARLKNDEPEVMLENFELSYWLDTIRHYGMEFNDVQKNDFERVKDNSPEIVERQKRLRLIAVQNKVDNPNAHKIRIAQELHDKYLIDDSFHISLREGSIVSNARQYKILESFLSELEYALQSNADKAAIPSQWQEVRSNILSIKNSSKNPFSEFIQQNLWIDFDDFKKGCIKFFAEAPSELELKTIAQWLDKGGVVVFFPKIEKLSDKLFLRPHLLAEKIYEILNEEVRNANGEFSLTDISNVKDGPMREIFIELAQQLDLIFPHPVKEKYYLAPQYLPESHPIEDLFKIASHGAWKSDLWIKVPLFFYKKILHGLLLHYAKDINTECRYFWKHGIMFTRKETLQKVLVKGMYPNENEPYGVILLGVEKDRGSESQKVIQKELFSRCIEIIISGEKSNISNNAKVEKQIDPPTLQNLISLLKEIDIDIQVSYDGVNYIFYKSLLEYGGEPKVRSVDGQTWLITHNFSSILPNQPVKAKKVFLSYSHQNTKWLVRLRQHLAGLRRAKQIETWDDKEILPGDLWDDSIKQSIEQADIFILLLSADFIASEYIWENELPSVIKKFKENDTKTIIPILFEPLDLSGLSFEFDGEISELNSLANFEIIPKDNEGHLKAVSLWQNPEEALANISERIRETIKK